MLDTSHRVPSQEINRISLKCSAVYPQSGCSNLGRHEPTSAGGRSFRWEVRPLEIMYAITDLYSINARLGRSWGYRRPSSSAGTMLCTPPPHFGTWEASAALPASLAENYLAAAHNNPMGCLHAHEPAASYLPLQASQKLTPTPPYTPRGYVFRLPQPCQLFRINDLQNKLIVPTSKKWPHFGRFSVQFEGISRLFWHFWRGCGGPFAAEQRHRRAQSPLDAKEKRNKVRD